jgi:enoyl-CoA hydratase/carnithine racemase
VSDDLVLYDVADAIATITLNRPEAANAQNPELLHQLDACWTKAAEDDDVKVIVLRGNGKHFSSGHDLRGNQAEAAKKWTVQDIYKIETHQYLGYSLKWRNVPKPSIAAVQGVCIAGGLLLAWPCDLIVAADNAKFSDPVVAMGIGGVEYHGHTWELGPRLAKEILFTGRAITAAEAKAVGMVNRVVPLEDLESATRELALEIASKHPWALRMAKRAVNQTLDVQGFTTAIQAVFDIHQLGHGHAMTECGYPVLVGLDQMKTEIASKKEVTGSPA